MPQNFPEIWLQRVIRNISNATNAKFLEDIPELDTPVLTLGADTATEQNIIHVPATTFKPDVLINNTTYPIALQAYDDVSSTIQLDKFQTKVTTVSDDQIMGASYEKIDVVTRTHVEAILEKKYTKAIHALAPTANTSNTPIIATTGTADATGRKRLIYDDLVSLKAGFDNMYGVTDVNRKLVLSSDHYNDLLLDRNRFADLLINYQQGGVSPIIAGFEIYQYVGNPYFNGGNKVAFGAVPGAGSYRASVAFITSNIAKKTGITKQYFAPAIIDPENQTNRLNYRHYFICVPMQNMFMGAIAS